MELLGDRVVGRVATGGLRECFEVGEGLPGGMREELAIEYDVFGDPSSCI